MIPITPSMGAQLQSQDGLTNVSPHNGNRHIEKDGPLLKQEPGYILPSINHSY